MARQQGRDEISAAARAGHPFFKRKLDARFRGHDSVGYG